MDFDNENRIVSPDLNEVDNDIETSLRPKTFLTSEKPLE